jgi:hypothetical protein
MATKTKKSPTIKDKPKFSVMVLGIIIALVVITGGYLIYNSFAATPVGVGTQEVSLADAGQDLTASQVALEGQQIEAKGTSRSAKILKKAKSQIGVCEGAKNVLPAKIKAYQQTTENGCAGLCTQKMKNKGWCSNVGYPLAWCASFVSWVYQNALGVKVPATCAVKTMQKSAHTGTPSAGDVVFHNTAHTGIFVKAKDGKYLTIEGNTPQGSHDCVRYKWRPASYWTSHKSY